MKPSIARLSRASNIGWIGLGAMGHPMAMNLFTKTYLAHVNQSTSADLPEFLFCEQTEKNADAFLAEIRSKGGAELARRVRRVGSGKEMAQEAARIVTMLPSTPQVESVYLDEAKGILSGILSLPKDTATLPAPEPVDSAASAAPTSSSGSSPHTLLIDQTTLDPTAAMAIASRIHTETDGKAVMLDAPVSGGIVAATSGSLTIMFGSPSETATSHALPLLSRMAREGGVIACGANGTGVGVKVCNNLILAINQIGLAEGLSLGRSLGIDPHLLHNVINSSSGQSWSSKVNTPLAEIANSPGSRGFTGGFQSRLMLKDVGLALHAAHQYDLPSPLGWAAKSVYEAVCQEGEGEMATKDFSVVLEWLKKKQEQGVERGWKDGAPEI